MLPELAATAAAQNGVFLRRQAVRLGYCDDDIRRLTRSGVWHRLRRGAYCESSLLATDEYGVAEFLRTQAAALVLQPPAYASHNSALSVLRLPLWGTPSEQSHFTRPKVHAGRHEAGIVHHEAALSDVEITTVRGIDVTTLERTPLDVSRQFGFQPGLVSADAALHAGADPDLMRQLCGRISDWAGSRSADSVVARMDGGAASPGETLSRIAVAEAGFEEISTQFEVRVGDLWAFIDLVVPECNLALEFDGRMKYRRTRDRVDPSIDDADVVWAEKEREDALRDLGFEVVRIIWADLFGARRVLLIRRIQRSAERGRRSGRSIDHLCR